MTPRLRATLHDAELVDLARQHRRREAVRRRRLVTTALARLWARVALPVASRDSGVRDSTACAPTCRP